MPWILTGVAVVALVLLVVVAHSLVLRRQRGGADRLARTLHLNARWWKDQRAKDGELLYVALGDSAAQGVGASQPGRSYVGLIAQHLRQRTGRSVQVVNLSISGARLREVIALQLAPLRRLSPDIVTVAVGANDMPTFAPDRFTRELAEVFDSLPADQSSPRCPRSTSGHRSVTCGPRMQSCIGSPLSMASRSPRYTRKPVARVRRFTHSTGCQSTSSTPMIVATGYGHPRSSPSSIE